MGLVRVAPSRVGPTDSSNGRLEGENCGRRFRRGLPVDHSEKVRHIREVRRLLLGKARRDVVVAVEAKTALADRDPVPTGCRVVKTDLQAENGIEKRSATGPH